MGILVLLLGLGGLGFGLFQHFKGKRILAAPFMKTGELAKNPRSPDPKGLISTEGTISKAPNLLSPCSKTPCLYYEVEVVRHYEKTETTQEGEKTTKGKETVETLSKGVTFHLDDGSGAILVDASEGGDFDNLTKKFDDKVEIGSSIPGELVFGQLRYATPSLPRDQETVAFEAVEKIVPATGTLYALGRIEQGVIGKPGWRQMMFSSKGREGLLAATAKTKKMGFIGGGIATLAAIPLMLFGPKGSGCPSEIPGVVAACSGHLSSSNSTDFSWKVTEEGQYTVTITPKADVALPLQSRLEVLDAKNATVAGAAEGSLGQAAILTRLFKPGEYTIRVKDTLEVDVKGGYDFSLAIERGTPVPSLSAAEPEPAVEEAPEQKEEEPAKPAKRQAKKRQSKRSTKDR